MRCDILGVAFDRLTLTEAVERAQAFLIDDRPHVVVTPNAEIVWMASRDSALRAALNVANLVLPDGVGIIRAARMLKYPLRERVAGIDFAQALLPILAEKGTSVFFLGGKPGVAEEAARRSMAIHPGLTVCGTRDGYDPPGAEQTVALAVQKSGAQVVFVCLGSPKQELFAENFGEQTGARLLICLGGTLDVWSGNVKRAPELFIKLGLEWLYRILRQPKRLIRALRLPAFLWKVHRQITDNR